MKSASTRKDNKPHHDRITSLQTSGRDDQGSSGRQSGRQGFASMDPQRQRDIASMGGSAAQRSGKAHRWTREEARQAGRKGGQK